MHLYKYKTAFNLVCFDVDGTLVATKTGEKFRQSSDDWIWLPGRVEKLRELHAAGIKLGIITNQGGVGMTYSKLCGQDAQMIVETINMARSTGCFPDARAVQLCFSHPDANYKPEEYQVKNDRRRKPNPGMLEDIQQVYGIAPQETLYVGDRLEDLQAAKNNGCYFKYADDFFR